MDGAEIREWCDNEALQPENLLVLASATAASSATSTSGSRSTSPDLDVAAPGCWDDAFDHAETRGALRARCDARAHRSSSTSTTSASWSRAPRLPRDPQLVDDGDRARRRAPPEPVIPDGIELRPYRHPEDEQRVYEALQEAFLDHWDFHPATDRELARVQRQGAATSTRTSGSSPGMATMSPARR